MYSEWNKVTNDESCEGCKYYRPVTSARRQKICCYIFDRGTMRPCRPGAECTEYNTLDGSRRTNEMKWNPEEAREKILQGKSIKEVADEFGIADASIHSYRKTHPDWLPAGYKKNAKGCTDEEHAELQRKYDDLEKQYKVMGDIANQKDRENEQLKARIKELEISGEREAQGCKLPADIEREIANYKYQAEVLQSRCEMQEEQLSDWEDRIKAFSICHRILEQNKDRLDQLSSAVWVIMEELR